MLFLFFRGLCLLDDLLRNHRHVPTFHDHVSAVQRPASDGLLDIGDDAGPGQPPDVFSLEFLPPALQDVDDPYLATLPSCLLTVVELPDRVCENSLSSRLGLL